MHRDDMTYVCMYRRGCVLKCASTDERVHCVYIIPLFLELFEGSGTRHEGLVSTC